MAIILLIRQLISFFYILNDLSHLIIDYLFIYFFYIGIILFVKI